MDGSHKFQVSEEELEYLKQLASHDPTLASMFSHPESSHDRRASIRLNRAQAEEVRDHLTDQLAAVGFDQNYSPNEQGQMLEKLIDRFFLR